jgi:hypothetical protein
LSSRFYRTVLNFPHPSYPKSRTPYQLPTAGPTCHTLLFPSLPTPPTISLSPCSLPPASPPHDRLPPLDLRRRRPPEAELQGAAAAPPSLLPCFQTAAAVELPGRQLAQGGGLWSCATARPGRRRHPSSPPVPAGASPPSPPASTVHLPYVPRRRSNRGRIRRGEVGETAMDPTHLPPQARASGPAAAPTSLPKLARQIPSVVLEHRLACSLSPLEQGRQLHAQPAVAEVLAGLGATAADGISDPATSGSTSPSPYCAPPGCCGWRAGPWGLRARPAAWVRGVSGEQAQH